MVLRLFLLLTLPSFVFAAPTLKVVIDGERYPVARVEKATVYASVKGREVALDAKSEFILEGDALEDPSLVQWDPAITRYRLTEPAKESGRTFTHVYHGSFSNQAPGAAWDGPSNEPRIIVTAVYVPGRACHASVACTLSSGGRTRKSLFTRVPIEQDEMDAAVVRLCLSNHGWVKNVQPDSILLQPAAVAILRHDSDRLSEIVAQSPDIGYKPFQSSTLIHFAAFFGRLEELKRLVGPDFARRELPKGDTPLALAAANGHAATVTFLAKAKPAWVNQPSGAGTPPIVQASAGNHPDVVKALLDERADPTANDGNQQTAFSVALNSGFSEIAAILEKTEPGLDFRSSRFTSIFATQVRLNHHAMVEYFFAKKVPLPKSADQPSLLQYAAAEADTEMVEILLKNGCDVKGTRAVAPALILAANEGTPELTRMLLKAGADVNEKFEGTTALRAAVLNDNAPVVKVLLEAGASGDVKSEKGLGLVEVGLVTHATESVRLLIDAGFRLTDKSQDPRSWVVRALSLDLDNLLPTLGDQFDWNQPLQGEWRALDIAEACQATKCQEWLRKKGATNGRLVPFAAGKALDVPIKVEKASLPADLRKGIAREKKETITVECVVDEEGRPLFPRTISEGAPPLRISAAESLAGWHFTVPRTGGKPAYARIRLPITFPAEFEGAVLPEEWDEPPKAISRAQPIYPFELKRRGVEGSVTLVAIVDTQGNVVGVRPTSLTNPAFLEPCTQAFKKWKFKPALIDGKPVPSRVTQTFMMSLVEE